MKIHKLDRKTESPARRKFRRIVMQKVIGVLTKKKGDHLSRVSSLLFGTKENPFNTKARLMRDETGDKVG